MDSIITVKTAQRAAQAARAAAKAAVVTVKAIAKATALAIKAIIAGTKSLDCRYRRRRLGGGFGYYRDLPDWYDPRLSIWHFLLRRRFRHWNEYADRCAGNQYRIRYQAARGKELGIL